MAQSSFAPRRLAFALAVVSLAGCSSINSMLEPDKIDYKSAGKAPSLDIPPDLTQLQRDQRYALPDNNRGSATASGLALQNRQNPEMQTGAAAVAPKTLEGMRIERAGNQRWLVVNQPPEALWPQIKEFWQDNGFLISAESPESGVMETDWAENRANIPQGTIRSVLGKALGTLYSTGERDKFRTRLERTGDGGTEIYVSHRGAEEVLVGQDKESSRWTPRPSDPELEAEFLSRLMARLGTDNSSAKTAVQSAEPLPTRSRLVKNNNEAYVEVNESFDRAWRRVGLALDRVGFTVEDRDRSQGIYFVRYVDQGQEAQSGGAKEKGLISRLFSFGSKEDNNKTAQRYRISVKGNSDISQVAVLNDEGRVATTKSADRILTLLNDQLK